MWQDVPDLHHAVAVDARLDIPCLAGDGSHNVGGFTDAAGVDGTDPELVGFTLDLYYVFEVKEIIRALNLAT